MPDKNINSSSSKEYWKEADTLFALAEEKNRLAAIKRTDTEKFYLFTKMMRITNTLEKLRASIKK